MDTLDMSLDDIIKSKKSAGRGRGRGTAPLGRGARGGSFSGGRMSGGGRGRGSGRQVPLRVNTRPSSSAIAKTFRRTKNFPWQRDLLEESLAAAGLPGMESGTKLYISNLDTGVSNDDIRELFTEIGELKRYAIHFDKSGRPSGSAEVVYAKRSDAFAAHKRYNNVQLDGRPMKIEVVSPGGEVPVSARIDVVRGVNGVGISNGRATRGAIMTQGRGRHLASVSTIQRIGQRSRGGIRGGQSQGRGRGRGKGRGRGGKQQEKSAEELDKELEKYHAEGMNVD
ncbi:hypothetical protein RND81_07G031300 [Saponaria officinalis]|uniref:RRM domain-containing protein n=2 Tax=Saponaria officinalis TaxID=3572 RepID=A0AAW1JMJ1_SAPOF